MSKGSGIHLNRKQRWWNKYGVFVIIAICAAAAVTLIVVLSVLGAGGEEKKDWRESFEEAETSSESIQESTAAAAAVKTSKTSHPVAEEEFTSKDTFANSCFIGDDFFSHLKDYGFIDGTNVFAAAEARVAAADVNPSDVGSKGYNKVFIMYGRNDLAYGNGATGESVADNVISLAEKIKEASPAATIYIVSETPISYEYERAATTTVSQSQINDLNAALEAKAGEKGFNYIDITGPLKAGNGYLNSDYTTNGYFIRKSYCASVMNGMAECV